MRKKLSRRQLQERIKNHEYGRLPEDLPTPQKSLKELERESKKLKE